jgi:hydrogenase maturation protease
MTQTKSRCLILACGNTLRSDDGVGPWLAAWAQEKYHDEASVRVISRQQWTPDLAEEIVNCETILFIDCCVESAPGALLVIDVHPMPVTQRGIGSHHQCPQELLALAQGLYEALPHSAKVLTIGAGSTGLSEDFSPAVIAALPDACALLAQTVSQLISLVSH